MLRSWNSSSTTVVTSDSSGSCCRRAVRMPSVTTSSGVVGREAPLEADVPADLAAERPAALLGDARGHGAHGHAARLQHEHAAGPTSAGGTRVVLPAPGAATSTAARRDASASTTAGRCASIGSGASITP